MKKFVAYFYSFVLTRRYKVKIVGKELINDGRTKLYLPNHQAMVDPQIFVSEIFKKSHVVPVITESYYNIPLLKYFFKWIKAVSVTDIKRGNRNAKVLDHITNNVNRALENGQNVVLYPSGQLTGQGYERILNKQSAYRIVEKLPAKVIVVGVRITGLWGSMWSKAWSGDSPPFLTSFIKAIFYVFINLIFFVPKRQVTMELVDITAEAKLKATDKLLFNEYLEKFYNTKGEEPVQYLKHYFFAPALIRSVPYQIEGSEKLIGKSSSSEKDIDRISNDLFDEISEIVKTHGEIGEKEIQFSSNLHLDLNIDSLGMVAICSAIENRYPDASAPSMFDLKTIADLCLMAMGETGEKEELKPSHLHKHKDRINNIEIFPDKTILQHIIRRTHQKPNEPWFYDARIGTTSRKDFLLKACVVAQLLKQEIKGKHVGVMLPALQSTTLLLTAIYIAGKVPVMLNWTVGKKILLHCVATSGLDKILTAGAFFDKVKDQIPEELNNHFIFLEKKLPEIGIITKLKGLLVSKLPAFFIRQGKPHDTGVILFTSGSESLPKMVPLTQRNLVRDLHGVLQVITLQNNQVILSFLPPFHSFGFTVLNILPLLTGLKTAFTPDPRDSKELVRMLRHTRASIICATPTFLKIILSNASKFDLKYVTLAITGAESLHPSLKKQFYEKAANHAIISEGYGITECSPCISINPFHKQKDYSVGKIIGGVECRIVDIKTYKNLPQGQEGMIMIKGDNVFGGYPDGAVENPFVDLNGISFYKTGDLGYLDEEGYLFITGRLKRFIKIAGEMISLPFIENILLEKFGESEEVVLAVEGSDQVDPPRIVLFTTKDLSTNEVNEFLTGKGVSGIMRINSIEKVDEIPLLGTGKTDYKVLKGKIT